MTDGIAFMTIKRLRVNVRHEEDVGKEDHRHEDTGCPNTRDLYQIPFHRIVMKDKGHLPLRSSFRAAGVDCYARTCVRIAKGTTGEVPLGFELAPAAGTYAQLHEIASWTVLNPNLLLRAGVIDPDFRGEVHALFTCTGQEEFGSVDK